MIRSGVYIFRAISSSIQSSEIAGFAQSTWTRLRGAGHDLTASIEAFVTHYNHQRYHESLSNLTPADVYFGRGQTILLERERIKRKTLQTRRLQHRKSAA